MKSINRTLLLPLLSRCRQLLEDAALDVEGQTTDVPVSDTAASPAAGAGPANVTASSRDTYDNAYFYILFVMVFYSFLAMTLFVCFIGADEEEKKDPSEEFTSAGRPSTEKFNPGRTEKFDFEEESGL